MHVEVRADGKVLLATTVALNAAEPVSVAWQKPDALVTITITANGKTIASYTEEKPDQLKKPPVKDPMPLAAEVQSADELYMAGLHVEQYRDPAVMPDAYFLEGLKRDPRHAGCLLGMAAYCYRMALLSEAENYARRAIKRLTKFNARIPSGDAYYQLGLILEAEGKTDEAYDYYRQAAWVGSSVSKAMTRTACIDLARSDYEEAIAHTKQVLTHDAKNPLAPVVLALSYRALGETEKADDVIEAGRQDDCFHMLLRWLSGMSEAHFFSKMDSEPAQTTLDMAFDLLSMGQAAQTEKLLTSFGAHCGHTVMTALTLAYALHLQGKPEDDALAAAETAPVGDTFPVRLGEVAVLQHALASGVKRAAFLLGCEYYDKRQYKLAGKLFEQSTHDEPDNYMTYRSLAIACFSHLNRKAEAAGDFETALSVFRQALTLPATLGAGIWNRCKYVPYQYQIAVCLEKLGKKAEADEIFRTILDIEIEFFSKMHLRELPWYQALSAEHLGLQQKAWNLMGKAKRIWTAELDKVDNGFFATTPFFISFAQPASELRKAYYGYLLGLVSLYEGENEQAAEWFRGLALRKLMRFTEAEQVLQEMIDTGTSQIENSDLRAYYGVGAPTPMPFEYDIVKINTVNGHVLRAYGLLGLGHREQALQEIEAAKKLSPNDFRIYAFEQIKDTF